MHVTGFVDSSFGTDVNGHSTSGYAYRLSSTSALVSHRSSKQSLVATSTVECEYYAIDESWKEGFFISQVVAEIFKTNPKMISLYSDSQGAIGLAKHPNLHRFTRHIEVKYHAIRSHIANSSVYLSYISTTENIADIFTKLSSPAKLKYHKIIHGKDPKEKKE